MTSRDSIPPYPPDASPRIWLPWPLPVHRTLRTGRPPPGIRSRADRQKSSSSGNRTPGVCVTGRNVTNYTNEDRRLGTPIGRQPGTRSTGSLARDSIPAWDSIPPTLGALVGGCRDRIPGLGGADRDRIPSPWVLWWAVAGIESLAWEALTGIESLALPTKK